MARDYYNLLGVGRSASDKEIRQAYRRLARKFHPDVSSGDRGDEAKFKEINEAYEVLSDQDNRRKYDQFGENWKHADQFAQTGAGRGGSPFFGSGSRRHGVQFDLGDLGDFGFGTIFDGMRGGFGRRGRTRTSLFETEADVPVSLTLEEALAGAARLVQMPMVAGSRARRLEVKIPPGVETGSRITVTPGQGIKLHLVVTVQAHRRFSRKGANLYVDLPIPLADAVLGGEQRVDTLNGSVMLNVPPESQNGQVFRLRGRGMPHLNRPDSRGDLFASLKVVLPTDLSDEERQFFQELRDRRDGKKVSA
ncbi:MAG: J domain-containing protein [Chloroflexi bacterium]|nr:J domain-containing protein [Chloroflexota bacterium]